WIALVELTPFDSRPYVGGSQTSSFLELTFGYNGFGRLTGNETGSVGGGGQGGVWGETGITRLFTGSFGQQVSWFLPAALFLLLTTVVLLVLAEAARRRGRTAAPAGTASGGRTTGHLGATVLMWAAWLVSPWPLLSHRKGIGYECYTVALIPAIAVFIGIGVAVLLSGRGYLPRVLLAVAWALTGAWQFIMRSEMSGIGFPL